MEPTFENADVVAGPTRDRAAKILFWVFTALFCLEMSFTAYFELTAQGGQAFARLGFPNSYFRFELSLAKLVGAVALLVPMIPSRLREWAYAGFAINLFSAVIAHLSISDQPLAFVPSTLTSVLWAVSYFSWRRLQSVRENQSKY